LLAPCNDPQRHTRAANTQNTLSDADLVAYGWAAHTCSGGATHLQYHMISLSGTDYQQSLQNLQGTGATQDLLSACPSRWAYAHTLKHACAHVLPVVTHNQTKHVGANSTTWCAMKPNLAHMHGHTFAPRHWSAGSEVQARRLRLGAAPKLLLHVCYPTQPSTDSRSRTT
jgi:hypothetical protein